MRYLLLIRGDESAAAHADEGCVGWSERMLERGVLQGGGGLRPPAEGRTVRVRRRELLLSDGPFAETKEQIGGFDLSSAPTSTRRSRSRPQHPVAGYGTDRGAADLGGMTVDRARAPSPSAFREEWGRVVATLIRVTGDWDLAEECAQDAFAAALRALAARRRPATARAPG